MSLVSHSGSPTASRRSRVGHHLGRIFDRSHKDDITSTSASNHSNIFSNTLKYFVFSNKCSLHPQRCRTSSRSLQRYGQRLKQTFNTADCHALPRDKTRHLLNPLKREGIATNSQCRMACPVQPLSVPPLHSSFLPNAKYVRESSAIKDAKYAAVST